MNDGVWVASYVALWVLVTVLAVTVLALLRQIGVLHARLSPMGTHFAGEGPDLGSAAPPAGVPYDASALTVLAFTSPTCTLCRELAPSLDAFRRQYRELRLELVDLEASPAVADAFRVRSTPYVVTVDRAGIVVGRGVANTLEQIEELVRESRVAGQATDGVGRA
jgi:thiol-disulfide isomerase/thioredoxin